MALRGISNLAGFRTFFVTTTVKYWLNVFVTDQMKSIVTDSFAFYCNRYNAAILGFVVMPNHVHFIIHFAEKNELGKFMRDFKKWVSVEVKRDLFALDSDLLGKLSIREKKGQTFQLWQERYDAEFIVSRFSALKILSYIHQNPVKKGWVDLAENYRFSSAGYYINNCVTDVPMLHITEIF